MFSENSLYAPLSEMAIASIPQLFQGPGSLNKLPEWLKNRGFSSVIICTGGKSFDSSACRDELFEILRINGIDYSRYRVSGEPSPELIDSITKSAAQSAADCVVGIGGGSVIDAAKAVSTMIPVVRREGSSGSSSVQDFLEGVGTRKSGAERLGLVAVPTDAP